MNDQPEQAQEVALATAGPSAPVQTISDDESVPAPACTQDWAAEQRFSGHMSV